MTAVLVFVGGSVGAVLRYLTDRFISSRHDMVFPWGTFTVNVVGSAVLGLLLALSASGALPPWNLALVGTGFCGALTTFSTFSFETVRLLEDGSTGQAALNVALSLVAAVGVGAATFGLAALVAS